MAIVRLKATKSMTWWVGIGLFVLAGAAFLIGRSYGRAGVMPNLAALSIMLLSAIHTIYGFVFGVVANNEEWHSDAERGEFARRRLQYSLVALAVGLGIWVVGFHITLPLFIFLFIGLSLGKWMIGAVMGFFIWSFTYLVLSGLLHIIFPASLLRKWMIANGYF